MPAEKNALPPQEADERLSRELLLRYMAAKAARPPLPLEDRQDPEPPAHSVRFPP